MAVAVERSEVRRQAIIEAAVALADSDGLDAVTMRNVAGRLGVGTMTLYSYVSSKDELLDLMFDEASGEMLLPDPLPASWRDALRAIALRTRETFDRHPWMLRASPPRRRKRLNFMRHIEQSLAAVAPLGVDDPTAGAILGAVDDYTLGHAVRTHARQRIARAVRAAAARGEPGHRDRAAIDPAVAAALEAGELPLLARRVAGRGFPLRLEMPLGWDFEQGLDWLLDGIEARWAPAHTR
jgi:AcrR family transcriptional regulator